MNKILKYRDIIAVFTIVMLCTWVALLLDSKKEQAIEYTKVIEKKDSLIEILTDLDYKQDSIINLFPPYMPTGFGLDENGEYILPTKKELK